MQRLENSSGIHFSSFIFLSLYLECLEISEASEVIDPLDLVKFLALRCFLDSLDFLLTLVDIDDLEARTSVSLWILKKLSSRMVLDGF